MVKKIAEKFNRLSRVHQRHRQTDRQQTTDGRLIAYSERNVVRSLKMKVRQLKRRADDRKGGRNEKELEVV